MTAAIRRQQLGVYVDGIGLLGPGLPDWTAAVEALTGKVPYSPQATVLPMPALLPAAERRRTGAVVKLALAVGLEAVARAGAAAASLPTVFAASGGDGSNCHEICQTLASNDRAISPTRFHNSVHNASAGYWSIATGATPASNVLCAFDASFSAGLLDAAVQTATERTAVLLIAYDATYPDPLRAHRPLVDAFGVAMVLAPEARPQSLARLEIGLTADAADVLPDAQLERLRTGNPAARSLPLLMKIAHRESGRAVLDYLDRRLSVELTAC